MSNSQSGTTAKLWLITFGLSIAVFGLALVVAAWWQRETILLFLALIAPLPLVLGYISRSWWDILSPVVAWLLFTTVWALIIVQVSHDPNVREAFSWIQANLWLVWPLLASGFVVGRVVQKARQQA